MRLSYLDVEELARALLGIGDEDDVDDQKVEEMLDEKFDISMDSFHKLAEALIEFVPVSHSMLTNTPCKAFVKDGFAICKAEVKP